jgi:hypothetical protein
MESDSHLILPAAVQCCCMLFLIVCGGRQADCLQCQALFKCQTHVCSLLASTATNHLSSMQSRVHLCALDSLHCLAHGVLVLETGCTLHPRVTALRCSALLVIATEISGSGSKTLEIWKPLRKAKACVCAPSNAMPKASLTRQACQSLLHIMLQNSCCRRLWLMLAVLAVTCTLPAQSQSLLGYTYCAGIADSDSRNYCLQYVNSNQAETKWNAAVLWSKYRPGHCKRQGTCLQSSVDACEA